MTHYFTWNNPRAVVLCALLLTSILTFLPSSASAQDFTITTTADFDAGTKNGTATVTDILNIPADQLQKGLDGNDVIRYDSREGAPASYIGVVDPGDNRMVAESFNFSSGNISIITGASVYILSKGGSGVDLRLDLCPDDGTGSPDEASPIISSNVISAGDVSLLHFNRFNFTTPYSISADTTYYIIFRGNETVTSGNWFKPRYNEGDIWSHGDYFWSIDGTSWTTGAYELSFLIWAEDYGGELAKNDYPRASREHPFTMALIDNKGYSIGGYLDYNDEWYEYDFDSDSYTQRTSLSDGRHAGQSTRNGTQDEMFYIGGGADIAHVRTINSRFNATSNSWTYLANSTYAVADTSAIYYEDKIYVIGGKGGPGDKPASPIILNTTQVYNVSTNTWYSIGTYANLTSARSWFNPVLVGSKIYAIGGSATNTLQDATSTVQIYDIAGDTWSSGTAMPKNINLYQLAVVGTDIWIIGGYDNYELQGRVWVYDTVGDSWSFKCLSMVRAWGMATYVNSEVHLLTGAIASDFESDLTGDTNAHHTLDTLTSATWTSATQTMISGRSLESLTIEHIVDTGYYISEVYLSVGGTEKARWSDDITSGTSTTLTRSSLTSGNLVDVNADFTITIEMVSNGTSTPIITQIEGTYAAVSSGKGQYSCDFQATIDGYRVLFDGWCDRDDALILHWIWDFGDGTLLYDDSHIDHEYSGAGTFNVSLEVIDHDGRTASVSRTITIGEGDSTSGFFWSGTGTFCWMGGAIILMVILVMLARRWKKKEET